MAATASPSERQLRDHLSANLDILEEHLVLVALEFEVPNQQGAKGFIDILARDRFGHHVVIELKRSDQAARTALHELHKYVALLRIQHGIGDEQVRAILVSTEWHELLVPFSEYVRSARYAVTGLQLRLDSSGVPASTESVVPTAAGDLLRLSPAHMIFFYGQNPESRVPRALKTISTLLANVGITDHVQVLADTHEKEKGEFRRSAIYVAMARPSQEQATRLEARFNLREEVEDPESDPLDVQAAWEGCVLSNALLELNSDEAEIGYPEKFVQLANDPWKIGPIVRSGRFQSKLLWPDQAILAALAGIGGDNSEYFARQATPKFPVSWSEALAAAEYCLHGSELWSAAYRNFMLDTASRASAAAVAVQVFHPRNLVFALPQLLAEGATDRFPRLEVVSDEGTAGVRVLLGFLDWNGVNPSGTAKELVISALSEAFDGLDDPKALVFAAATHEAWMMDAPLLRRFGICYRTVLVHYVDRQHVSTVELFLDGASIRSEPNPKARGSVFAFARANADLVRDLEETLIEIGLRDLGR